ncbi:MAG: hypothetical protein QNK11_01750 [Legionella sp.]|nr:hypothetical protein [Legionella sp.]
MSQQKGFLLITAVIMIVVFAVLSTVIVATVLRTTEMTLYPKEIPAADALAESGLDQARKNITQTNLSTRQTCTGLASTITLATGNSISGPGTNTTNNPRHAYATLQTAIVSNTTPSIMTVNNSSVFAPSGWVLIGREMFQYDRIASSTTLGGVSRAQDGTEASTHVAGSVVSQYQCSIAGIGHAPAINPRGIREYQQGMNQPILFSVGEKGRLMRWNGPVNELVWASENSGTNKDLYGVSALNYHSAWAVGKKDKKDFMLSRLQGNSWSSVLVRLGSSSDLYSVDAVSENEAWAVGQRKGKDIAILRWVRDASNSNNNWCRVPCSGITLTDSDVEDNQKSIYAVKTLDLNGNGFANMGFAAGGANKDGVIWYYSGTGWSPIDKAPLKYTLPSQVGQLVGVDITRNGNNAPKEAFFVGRTSSGKSKGKLLRLQIINGKDTWNSVDLKEELAAVSIVDTNGDGWADFGCAVGEKGSIVTFDGNMNTTVSTMSGKKDLKAVVTLSASDIWVSGKSGVRFHYDGSNWVSLTANVNTNDDLNGLSGVFPKQIEFSRWHEFIN